METILMAALLTFALLPLSTTLPPLDVNCIVPSKKIPSLETSAASVEVPSILMLPVVVEILASEETETPLLPPVALPPLVPAILIAPPFKSLMIAPGLASDKKPVAKSAVETPPVASIDIPPPFVSISED